MTPERYQQISRLLDAALERGPDQRAAFLAESCGDDETLRREVESLLAACAQAGSFIEEPPAQAAAELIADHPAQTMTGRTLGRYQLGELLGAGGMGEVYHARDLGLDRSVAVKILPDHLAANAEALRRFEREAKAVAALSHPNVCAIHDFGIEQGVTYAVMELLEGETLRVRLARSALPWREASEIGAAVADGLAAAHARGIVHRDLKPENVFLTAGGRVKVLDFGIARVKHLQSPGESGTGTMTDTTRPGTIIGTVGYMSPEQVRAETAEATSDIFSLGCVLYEMVSGRRPFARGNVMETLAAILKEEPVGLSKEDRAIPRRVEGVIRRCLEKQPARRYQSARDLGADLRALVAGTSVKAAPVNMPTRRRAIVWLTAVIVTFLLAGLAWLSRGGRRDNPIDSIAVLPFVNVGGDPEMEDLSDGIADSISYTLSQLPRLRVMARGSTSRYKGGQTDLQTVGRELGVRAVVTGRVALRGESLMIKAELVDVSDNRLLWREQYNQTAQDILAVQVEISKRISEKLQLTLTSEERRRLSKSYTDNTEAFRLYTKGRYYSLKLTTEGAKKGIEHLNGAIDLDPTYALAWAGLAFSYFNASTFYLGPDEAMPLARSAATKALQLDGQLAEAHTVLALVEGQWERDWVAAQEEFKRAIEASPSYAPARLLYGMYYLLQQGRVEEAIAEMNRAHELDPLALEISTNVAWAHYLAGRYDEAIARLLKILEMAPNFFMAHISLGLAYERKGMFEQSVGAFQKAGLIDQKSPYPLAFIGHVYATEGKREKAQSVLDKLKEEEKAKRGYIDSYVIAVIYVALGKKDEAFAWLEKAFLSRSEELLLLKVDPRLNSLHSDPRFNDLLRRLNLAP